MICLTTIFEGKGVQSSTHAIPYSGSNICRINFIFKASVNKSWYSSELSPYGRLRCFTKECIKGLEILAV
jgi:hypothetical protein